MSYDYCNIAAQTKHYGYFKKSLTYCGLRVQRRSSVAIGVKASSAVVASFSAEFPSLPMKANTKVKNWKDAFKDAKPFLSKQLPKNRAAKELEYALYLFQKEPKLKNCTYDSILFALQNIAHTQISLNTAQNLAYLDARDSNCYFELTYKGLIKILIDSKTIKLIDAFIVYEDEQFEYVPTQNYLFHIPNYDSRTDLENASRKIRGAYSKATLNDGFSHFHFVDAWKLKKVEVVAYKPSFYSNWREDMYKKIAIRSHYKFLPKNNLPEHIEDSFILDVENFFPDAYKLNRKGRGMFDYFSNPHT